MWSESLLENVQLQLLVIPIIALHLTHVPELLDPGLQVLRWRRGAQNTLWKDGAD